MLVMLRLFSPSAWRAAPKSSRTGEPSARDVDVVGLDIAMQKARFVDARKTVQ